jgi:hypothetical protein
MSDRIIFMGWNRAHVGLEKQSMKVFQRAIEYFSKLQKGGRIESYDIVSLSPHGGDLNAFVMLRGEGQKLAEIKRDDTFIQIVFEANFCVQGCGVITGSIGAGAINALSRWASSGGN